MEAMMETPVPAVVVGAYINALGITRCLGREGIPVDVVRSLRLDMAHTSRYVRRVYSLFEINNRPEALVEFLEQNVDKLGGAILIPSNDHALIAMAKHHEQLSRNYLLTTPSWQLVRNFIDKSVTAKLAREVGIAVPKVYGNANAQFTDAEKLQYPVLVKPVQGHQFAYQFRCKLFKVHSAAELAEVIKKVEAQGFDCEIIAFIEGPDSAIQSFQVYIDRHGKPHGSYTWRRLRQEPPLFGVTRAGETAELPELVEPSLALLEKVGWRGIASFTYKVDAKSGRPYLMEVNGRCPMSHGVAARAGINYPLMAYSEAATGEIRGCEPNGWQGVWLHLHGDFFSTVKNLGKEQWTWKEFIGSYLRPKSFAVLAGDDLNPFLFQWWGSFRKTPRWLRQIIGQLLARARNLVVQKKHNDAARSSPSGV